MQRKNFLKFLCATLVAGALSLLPAAANAQLLQGPGETEQHQCLLPVRYHLYSEDPAMSTIVEHAVFLWNTTVGYSLFQPAEYEDKLDLVIGVTDSASVGRNTNTLGLTQNAVDAKGCIEMSLLLLLEDSIKSMTYAAKVLVVAHELGHVLGLSHSFDRANLMYPTISGRTKKILALDCKQREKLNTYIPVDQGDCKVPEELEEP